MTPYPYWEETTGTLDILENPYGWIDLSRKTASPKVVGHGLKFFHAQLLLGDGADNIKGIQHIDGSTVGAVRAYQFLNKYTNEGESANDIVKCFYDIKQNVLAEAELLFLHRNEEDSAYNYFKSLNLDSKLNAWLDELHEINLARVYGGSNGGK